MHRIVFAIVALVLSTGAAHAWDSNSGQAAAYANYRRVGEQAERLRQLVIQGKVDSGAKVIQYWQGLYPGRRVTGPRPIRSRSGGRILRF